MRTCVFCMKLSTSLLPLLLQLLLLHVGGTGGQPHTASSQTLSYHQAPTEALKEVVMVPEGDVLEEAPVVVLEMVVVIKKVGLERTIRETHLMEEEPCSHDTSTRFRVKETYVVHQSEGGRLLLATGLGTCVGFLVGGLVALALAYCYFRCRRGGSLDFDQKNSTYRSAEVIDNGV